MVVHEIHEAVKKAEQRGLKQSHPDMAKATNVVKMINEAKKKLEAGIK